MVRRYLDILTDALMVRQLPPWFANLKKRQVKAPKIYVRDSGLLHRLLGIDTETALLTHPRVGASWKGFVIEQVLAAEPHDEAYFRATHQGAEIDLVLRRATPCTASRANPPTRLASHRQSEPPSPTWASPRSPCSIPAPSASRFPTGRSNRRSRSFQAGTPFMTASRKPLKLGLFSAMVVESRPRAMSSEMRAVYTR